MSERVLSRKDKVGRSGPFQVLTVEHHYYQDEELCIREERDIVYLQGAAPAQPAPDAVAALDNGTAAWSLRFTPDPVTLPADSAVAFALNRMVMEGFRHIPLVDDHGYPTGMVSMRDLIDYLTEFFGKDVLNLPPDPTGGFRSRDGA